MTSQQKRDPKPSWQQLLKRTERGGRVFLFTYPVHPDHPKRPSAYLAPPLESQRAIAAQWLTMPGCETFDGPLGSTFAPDYAGLRDPAPQ